MCLEPSWYICSCTPDTLMDNLFSLYWWKSEWEHLCLSVTLWRCFSGNVNNCISWLFVNILSRFSWKSSGSFVYIQKSSFALVWMHATSSDLCLYLHIWCWCCLSVWKSPDEGLMTETPLIKRIQLIQSVLDCLYKISSINAKKEFLHTLMSIKAHNIWYYLVNFKSSDSGPVCWAPVTEL